MNNNIAQNVKPQVQPQPQPQPQPQVKTVTTTTPSSSSSKHPTSKFKQYNTESKFKKCIEKCGFRCNYKKLSKKSDISLVLDIISKILLFFIVIYLINSIFNGFKILNNDTINLDNLDLIKFIRKKLQKTKIYIGDDKETED